MGLFKRAWDGIGWIVGGYTIYKQLQTMSDAKNELYSNLSPDQQAQWQKVFGQPDIQITNPIPVAVRSVPVTSVTAAPITQIKAGT